jgi:Bacterial Ig-like domain (group 3)
MYRSSRRLLAALIGVVTPGVVVIPLTPALAQPSPVQTVSFHFTARAELWTVPTGVSALRVVADGARGGQGGPRGLGGLGAEESAIVAVTPGDVIEVEVGGTGGQVRTGGFPNGGEGGHQGGPAGNDGGGGGGASLVERVRIVPTDPPSWHIIAGGGGGGGGSQAGIGGDGGRGGDAGKLGWGGAGGSASAPGCFWIPRPSLPGGGGGNGTGGPGSRGVDCGAADPGVGGAGRLDIGGSGADAVCCVGGGGGGGGGGFGGGGGGGAPDSAGGGGDGGSGGGSGAVGPEIVPGSEATRDGVNDGDGFVVIAYIVGAPTTMSLTWSPGSPVSGQPVSLSATVHPVPDGGTVQFSVDGVNVGAPVPVDPSTGKASLPPIPSLGVGSHAVSASYSGTTDFAASTSFAPSQQSDTVQVLPDTDPPAVSVTAPSPPPGQNGYVNLHDLAVAGGAIAVNVSASDASGTVTDIACTDNGTAVAVAGQSGSNPRTGTISVSTNGAHAVSCTATDSAGNSGNNGGPNTATVNIDSTAPLLTVPVRPVMVNATEPDGALVSSYPALASDSDPGDDPSISCTPPAPHQFAIGDTTVNCQATDQAGNTSAVQQFVVHVAGAGEQLDNLATAVQGVGPGNSLSAKVASARRKLNQGDTCAACAELTAFINEVTAQAGKKIPINQAGQLIADAQRIKAVIGC